MHFSNNSIIIINGFKMWDNRSFNLNVCHEYIHQTCQFILGKFLLSRHCLSTEPERLNGLDENSKVEQQYYCSFQGIILLCTLSSGKSVGIYVTALQNTKELNAVWNTKEFTFIKL